jgi:hypothetical protein
MTPRPKVDPWTLLWMGLIAGVLFLLGLVSSTPYFKIATSAGSSADS